jgi:hypothetical protein
MMAFASVNRVLGIREAGLAFFGSRVGDAPTSTVARAAQAVFCAFDVKDAVGRPSRLPRGKRPTGLLGDTDRALVEAGYT